MEVQLNVAQDNGEQIEGEYNGKKWLGFTDNIQTWKSFRIPYGANGNPTYEDKEIRFDLDAHAEGIGLTGWDWKNKVSRWVAFDFDAIVGHSTTHTSKLSVDELQEIQDLTCEVPWVTTRLSTSGNGLHLYVFLPSVPTANHTEHAALGRSILHLLSSEVGFDFESKVDVCVPMDTWTLTDEGPRQVKDLINKSTNLIVNGKTYSTEGFFETGRKEVFEITTIEGYKVQATANHPFLVDYDGIELWQRLDNLQIGDRVKLNNHTDVEWEGEGDFNEGYILGWLVGDGYLSKNTKYDGGSNRPNLGYMRSALLFDRDDYESINYVANLFKVKPKVSYDGKRGSILSREIEHLRIKFGMDEKKQISNFIEEASSDFLKGFVSAFFDTDGTVELNAANVTLSQSNLPRLLATQRILLRFGINSSVVLKQKSRRRVIQGKNANCKSEYELHIRKENVLKFNERIGFKHLDKNIKLQKEIYRVQTGRTGFHKENYTCRVKSIKSLGVETVYDITVPNVHSFDANGFLVHNCGGNMWLWHRKQRNTNGLKIIKQGVPLDKVPENWKSHIQVTSGRRRVVLPDFVTEDGEAKFVEIAGQRSKVNLDKEHLQLIKYLKEQGKFSSWWDSNYNMLVSHSLDLKQAHADLNLKGIFETTSSGSTTHNVYLFPLRKGEWVVRRYGIGASESNTWSSDSSGYTMCYLNKSPDLKTLAACYGGIEHPTGGYVFKAAEDASKAALGIGVDIDLPPEMQLRETKLKLNREGKLVVEVDKRDNEGLKSWLPNKTKWTKVFHATKTPFTEEIDISDFDDMIRHVVAESGGNAGWLVKSEGQWIEEPLAHVQIAIKSLGLKDAEAKSILGNNIFKPWKLTNLPFQPEYPGDRRWNRNAAQFRYAPDLKKDELEYPHWKSILTHIGSNLDEGVSKNVWCKSNGILSGSDYLKCWCASMFQFPFEQLPYLFLYGNQRCGKSILHEALGMLMTSGYKRADQSLKSTSGFNGELEKAVLCVVEEVDLNQNKAAYNLIKDFVTALEINIHIKGKTPFMVRNTTHWIQCANEREACPVFDDDTRIIMLRVESLEKEIGKRQLLLSLRKEAPDFLASLLKLELPECNDRLRVPVIETEEKIMSIGKSRSLLEQFIAEECYYKAGHKISVMDFHARFHAWMDASDRFHWSKHKISKQLPDQFIRGRDRTNSGWCYGNISFDKDAKEGTPYHLEGDKLSL